jgi:membrane protein
VAVSHVRGLATRAKIQVERARARYDAIDVVAQAFKRHSLDDGSFYAASLTYYTFFSIFPLMLFATAALGFVTFLSPATQAELVEAGKSTFPLTKQLLKAENLDVIKENRAQIALIALVLGLYTGSGAVVALQHSLNRIHRVGDRGSTVAKRLDAIRWLGMFAAITIASVALAVLGAFAPGLIKTVFAYVASFAVSLLLFASAFRFLPNRTRQSWLEVLPGALIATLAFELMKIFGRLYVQFGTESRTTAYGVVFATAATLLIAAYVLCQVTLLGAEVNAVLAERRASREFSLAAHRAAESKGEGEGS